MAQSFQEVVDAIGTLVLSTWNTATSSAPLFFPNIDEDPPEGSIWGRYSIRMATGERASLGSANARFRRNGVAFVQIFVPKNTGMDLAYSVGNTLVVAFEDAGEVDGNVWFRDVALKEVGADTSLAFHQVNVEIPFTFDRSN